MKGIYKLLQIACYLALILPAIMAIYGVFRVIGSIPLGITEFGLNLTVEVLMLVFVFLFYKASIFFNKKAKLEEKTQKIKMVVEPSVTSKVEPIRLLDPDMDEYPDLKSVLFEIRDYQKALREKDIRTGSYLDEALNELLELYEDIVSTPMKNTERGEKFISEIQDTLIQIRDTLAEIYSNALEGTQNETEVLVTALKNKLASDGLIPSKYDINQFRQS